MGLIPGSGRSPAGGEANPLQYACLENPVDREAWQITNSQTRLERLSLHAHIAVRVETNTTLQNNHTPIKNNFKVFNLCYSIDIGDS